MSTWAIIPAKCFERAKSRLAPVLSAPERRRLSENMFRHVLDVALGAPELSGVVVVTECPTVTRLATARGAAVVRDARSGQLGESMDEALRTLPLQATSALILMGDLPHLCPEDVSALLEPLDRAHVVLAPDRVDEGTNALALRLPLRVNTAFGRTGSYAEHLLRFREAAVPAATLRTETLAFDVDWPQDVPLIEGAFGAPALSAVGS
jgi:2-phospho-L-lactate guanylyltransferase